MNLQNLELKTETLEKSIQELREDYILTDGENEEIKLFSGDYILIDNEELFYIKNLNKTNKDFESVTTTKREFIKNFLNDWKKKKELLNKINFKENPFIKFRKKLELNQKQFIELANEKYSLDLNSENELLEIDVLRAEKGLLNIESDEGIFYKYEKLGAKDIKANWKKYQKGLS